MIADLFTGVLGLLLIVAAVAYSVIAFLLPVIWYKQYRDVQAIRALLEKARGPADATRYGGEGPAWKEES